MDEETGTISHACTSIVCPVCGSYETEAVVIRTMDDGDGRVTIRICVACALKVGELAHGYV